MFSCFSKSHKANHKKPPHKESGKQEISSLNSIDDANQPSIKEKFKEKEERDDKKVNWSPLPIIKESISPKFPDPTINFKAELKFIEGELKTHYHEIEEKMMEEFQVLEKMVIGELRKTRLQMKMNIENELEIHLLNIQDIQKSMETSSDSIKPSNVSLDKITVARRTRVNYRGYESWSSFYSYFLENKKELLRLISCDCNFTKAQTAFASDFEKTLKVRLLESFEKSRLFLSEIINSYHDEYRLTNMGGSNSESASRTSEMVMNENLRLNLLKGKGKFELKTIFKPKQANLGGENLKAPVILSYYDDLCFYSEQNDFINLVELKTGKTLWSSQNLGAEVLDICWWAPNGSDTLAAILNNNYIVWGAIHITDSFANISLQASEELQIEYGFPYSLIGIRGLATSHKALVCASNGSCCVYDFPNKMTIMHFQIGPSLKKLSCFTFVSNFEFVVFGSGSLKTQNENLLSVYSVKNIINECFVFSQHHCFLNCHELPQGALSISSLNKKDSHLAISSGFGVCSVKVWNVMKKEKIASISVEEPIFQVCLAQTNESLVAFASSQKNLVFLGEENNEWEFKKMKIGRAKGSVRKSLMVSQDSENLFVLTSNLFGEIEFYSIPKN